LRILRVLQERGKEETNWEGGDEVIRDVRGRRGETEEENREKGGRKKMGSGLLLLERDVTEGRVDAHLLSPFTFHYRDPLRIPSSFRTLSQLRRLNCAISSSGMEESCGRCGPGRRKESDGVPELVACLTASEVCDITPNIQPR